MRAQPGVVAEGEGEPALEVGPEERPPRAEVGDGLERPEGPLDEGDGTRLADGSVAVAHAEMAECLPKRLRRGLRSLVGDGVSGRAEAARGGEDETRHVLAARLREEHPGREGHPREDVEHDGELVGEEPKAGAHGTGRGSDLWRRRGCHRLLLSDPLDGPAGEAQPRPGEVCGERAVAGEAGQSQTLHRVADEIAVAPDGRNRLQERADGGPMRLAKSLLLPAVDGARRDAKPACDLEGGKGEDRLEAQDAVAGLGRVVGPLAVGDLVPAGAEDVERLLEDSDVEDVLVELGEAVEDRVAAVAVLAKPLGEGEAEEVRGFDEGLEGERVEAAPRHGGPQKAVKVGRRHGGTRLSRCGSRAAGGGYHRSASGCLPSLVADDARRARGGQVFGTVVVLPSGLRWPARGISPPLGGRQGPGGARARTRRRSCLDSPFAGMRR
jgi:hypothetical protein